MKKVDEVDKGGKALATQKVWTFRVVRGDANAPAVLALKSKIHGYLDEVPIAVTNTAGPWTIHAAD